MKKRILSLLLIICMVMAMTPMASAMYRSYFSDVNSTDWFSSEVEWAYKKDLMNGVGGDKFNPGGTTNRGMIVTILWRMADEPAATAAADFTDVKESDYFANAVAWASEEGIVGGYGNGRFGPSDPITREQLASILYRYAKYCGERVTARADLSVFADEGKISEYAYEALSWANAEDLITGIDADTLAPQGKATRAQVAVILYRFDRKVLGTGLEGAVAGLAILNHDHDYEYKYTDDGKHVGTCKCGETVTEDCTMGYTFDKDADTHDYLCEVCGHKEIEDEACDFQWISNDDDTHREACDCGNAKSQDKACDLVYISNNNCTHNIACEKCGRNENEEHEYGADERCIYCKAVMPVAVANKIEYRSLLAAVIGAEEGSTITLLRHDEYDGEIEIDKSLTIEGAKENRDTNFYGILRIKPDVKVVLKDITLTTSESAIVVEENAHLVCKGVTFSSEAVGVSSEPAIDASSALGSEIEVLTCAFQRRSDAAIKTCTDTTVTGCHFEIKAGDKSDKNCGLWVIGNTEEIEILFSKNIFDAQTVGLCVDFAMDPVNVIGSGNSMLGDMTDSGIMYACTCDTTDCQIVDNTDLGFTHVTR